jgi:hypothetical protein
MSPVQWTDKTSLDLPAGGPDLVWEQEAAGSNPAIPTSSEARHRLLSLTGEPKCWAHSVPEEVCQRKSGAVVRVVAMPSTLTIAARSITGIA